MNTAQKIRLKKRGYDTTVVIEGQDVAITVARFTKDQFAGFKRDYNVIQDPPHRRPLRIRKDDEQSTHLTPAPLTEAQEALHARVTAWLADDTTLSPEMRAAVEQLLRDATPRPVEAFVLDDETIARRRLAEMSAEQRAEWDRQKDDYDRWFADFTHQAIAAYVRVAPGQISVVDDDGQETDVTEGTDLAALFASHPVLLGQLVGLIYAENIVSESLKNDWRSRFGSTPSSSGRAPEAPGPTPATTATGAASEASAPAEDATASSAPSPSGSTATATS